MKLFITLYLLIGLGLSALVNLEIFGLVEPLFYIIYLVVNFRKSPKEFLNLGTIFAVGQLIITLSNAQLSASLLAGQTGGMYDYIIPEFMKKAHIIHFVGNLCFLLGYNFFKLDLKWINNTISINKVKTLFVISFIVLLNKFIFHISLPGSFNSLMNWVPLASIMFISRLSYINDNKTIRSLAIALMITTILMAFLYATLRLEMVLPILAYFLGAFLAKPKISFFLNPHFYPFYAGGLVFVFFFFAFGLIRGSTHGTERFKAITEAKTDHEEMDLEEKHGAFQRAADLAQITNCIDLKSGNNFYQGETIAILGVALIPRFLWPSKPVIALGVWFAIKIGKALETESGWYNTSINMTVPGHLWLEFGWFGMGISMLLIGLFYQLIWSSCGSLKSPHNYTGSLLGSYLLLTVLNGLGADLQILITLLALFLIVVFISKSLAFLSS